MWNLKKELLQSTGSWNYCDGNEDEQTEEEEYEITDTEDEVTKFDSNVCNTLLAASKNPGVFENVSFDY